MPQSADLPRPRPPDSSCRTCSATRCATTAFCSSASPRRPTQRCSSRSTSSTGSFAREIAPRGRRCACRSCPRAAGHADRRPCPRARLRLRRSPAETHIEMLEQLAPPSVLIDDHWNVDAPVRERGPLPPAARRSAGAALTDLVPAGAHRRAASSPAQRVRSCTNRRCPRFVPVRFNGTPRLVAVLVQPRRASVGGGGQHSLVTFLEAGDATGGAPPERAEPSDRRRAEPTRQAAQSPTSASSSMRQEHGMAYEDLRAANEELQSLNEEYRSTTEELETSKEELQSVNEELQTVNQELKMKLEEVSRVQQRSRELHGRDGRRDAVPRPRVSASSAIRRPCAIFQREEARPRPAYRRPDA